MKDAAFPVTSFKGDGYAAAENLAKLACCSRNDHLTRLDAKAVCRRHRWQLSRTTYQDIAKLGAT